MLSDVVNILLTVELALILLITRVFSQVVYIQNDVYDIVRENVIQEVFEVCQFLSKVNC